MKKIGIFIIAILMLSICFGCSLTIRPMEGSGYVEDNIAAKEVGYFDLVAFNAQGEEVWRETIKNAIADEGEQNALQCWLGNSQCATNYYIGLSDSSDPCSIAEANNLATASAGEPSTNGYSRQTIGRSADWTIAQINSGTDGCTETNCYRAVSTTETFSASGGSWGPVKCVFLATTSDNTGKLISWAELSVLRTLADQESLQVTYRLALQ